MVYTFLLSSSHAVSMVFFVAENNTAAYVHCAAHVDVSVTVKCGDTIIMRVC